MSNYDIIAQFFRSKGYDANAVYGILGNARDESNGSPTAYSGQPGTGWGLFQWLGGRLDEFNSFAASHGGRNSLQAQLEFAWHEITTKFPSMLPRSLNGHDPASAAIEWASTFEGASQSNWQQRANYAENFARTYKIPGGTPNFAAASGGGSVDYNGGNIPMASNKATAADYAAAEGPLAGLFSTNPELNGILHEAVAQQWSQAIFQQHVENSQWYRTHSDSARQALALQVSDPATYKQNLQQLERQVQQVGGQLGENFSDPKRIAAIAQMAMMQGWSTQDLQAALAKNWSSWFSGTQKWAGQAATYRDQLEQVANQYGVPFTGNGMVGWVQGMLNGNTTIEQYKARAIAQAKSIYRGVADQITPETDLRTIADPYISTMANVLELDPQSLGIQTPQIKRALQGTQIVGGNGSGNGQGALNNGQVQSTPIWQFEQQLRDDPRYAFTNGARDAVSSALLKLGSDWGFGPASGG